MPPSRFSLTRQSARIVVYCSVAAVLVSLIVVTYRAGNASGSALRALPKKFSRYLAYPPPLGVEAPSLEVKLEMLRKNPSLSTEVAPLLASRGGTPNNDRDFHVLFDYYYLIDDHESLASLVRSYDGYSKAIDHLDFAYLLPAYLYERLGLLELAVQNYHRYLAALRDISFHHALRAPRYQRRLTVARAKLEFLAHAIPGVRQEYYGASYLSALEENFFAVNLNHKRFLRRYADDSLVRVPEEPGETIEFDIGRLAEYIKGRLRQPADDPYAAYEACAAELRGDSDGEGAPRPCSIEDALGAAAPDSVLHSFTRLVEGRLLSSTKPLAARRVFQQAESELTEKTEFLRDDLRFELAMTLIIEGRELEGKTALDALIKQLGSRGPYDFGLIAAACKRDFVVNED
jgi:hypothetical protein